MTCIIDKCRPPSSRSILIMRITKINEKKCYNMYRCLYMCIYIYIYIYINTT